MVLRMRKTIYFDMDGTIADLYRANDWLERLLAEEKGLFLDLEPMHDKEELTEILNRLKDSNYGLEVITWTPKDVSNEYVKTVEQEKRAWMKRHFPMIEKIMCLEYGTPKQELGRGILFDDEKQNRINWKDKAYDERNILETLGAIA